MSVEHNLGILREQLTRAEAKGRELMAQYIANRQKSYDVSARLDPNSQQTKNAIELLDKARSDLAEFETRLVSLHEERARLLGLVKCAQCKDARWVCEQHQDKPQFHDDCPGPGMPCPRCNPEANDKATVIENVDVRSTDNQTD
jgi:hypothetical protein